MNRIETSQGPIEYRDVGRGPVVVFVHGLLVDGELWRDVVPILAGTHRCIVPDWPLGSHRLPMNRDADLSPTGVAALVAELLEALDLRDVTLVGNDSGGAISQVVAARHGDRVGRLVLTNCDAFEVFPPPAFAYLRLLPRIPGLLALMARSMLHIPPLRRMSLAYGKLARHRLPGELLERWVTPAGRDRRIRRDAAKFIRGATPEVTLAAAVELAGFGKPIRLVWGRNDPFFTTALAERLAAALPTARLDLVDDAGTFVALDQPAALAKVLIEGADRRAA